MIEVLAGDNSFEIQRALDRILDSSKEAVERVDGSKLQLAGLADILTGSNLFNTKRTVVIRGLSENKVVWPVLADWLPRINDDIHLVLIESKLDKRTTAYKALQKNAEIKEFISWTDKDYSVADKWLENEAKSLKISLNKKLIQHLINRVGLDQWQLYHALQKLSLVDELSELTIDDLVEANPIENVFNLLETTLSGDIRNVKRKLDILKKTEDVYRLMSLLSSQVCQLVVVASSGRKDHVAKDFAIHPFVISRMSDLSRQIKQAKLLKIVSIMADCDRQSKSIQVDPWIILEEALLKIARLK